MPPPPISVMLVGCGAVSQLFYTPALLALEAAGVMEVTTIVDPETTARHTVLAHFPRAQSLPTMPTGRMAGLGLAIIASPPRWHAVQTIQALEHGWNALCEKPVASSSDEAQAMQATADACGRVLAVGHYKRFFPSSVYLKALCAPGGPLGALCSFTIAEGGPFTWPAASASFFKKTETSGGVLLDMGVHTLDLLLWCLGEPQSFSYADDAMGGLEANAMMTIRFGSVVGRIQFSRDWPTAQRFEFTFEGGTLAWTVNDANGVDLALPLAPYGLHATLRGDDAKAASTNAQSFIAQLQNVAAALIDHSPVLVDGREGARALRLIEACYACRTLLPQPWLTANESQNAQAWAVTA